MTADTEEHAHKVWDKFLHHLYNSPLKALLDDHSRERDLVTLKTGATAQLLSANNPATLSGDGVTFWLIDEAQFLTQEAWNNLLPSIADRNGVIVLLGVAEGEGPFRELCFNGMSPDLPEYSFSSYPTSANPYVQPWVIEFARRTLSPTKFAQLFLATWEGAAGKIFRGVEAHVLPESDWPIHRHEEGWGYIELPKPGHIYRVGLDLARFSDWTVCTIWDRRGKLVAWDRFSRIDWELQIARIKLFTDHWNAPHGYADSTGLGDAVVEDLQRKGVHVEGVQIYSNAVKNALVDAYAIRHGAGGIKYPKIRGFVREHLRFEAKKSPRSQAMLYGAPSGENDDWVMSAALANKALPPLPSPILRLTGEGHGRRAAAYEAI